MKTSSFRRFINYTPDMPQVTTRQLISDAFRVWSDATPLSFTEVSDHSADIMIQFASQYHSDGYPFDGKGMVLGHAFFPGADKGGDTHFDDDENWTVNSTDGVDLFMVAAHEFGHALGLAHSGDPSALMYPWYMGFEGKFKLPEDDLRGIISLYGSGEKDRYLPEKDKKVNMIPDSARPPKTVPYDIDPTVKPQTDDKSNEPPDPCRSHIDALTVIRTEIFLFIGKWFWRMDSRKLIPNPVEIHQFWYGFPKELDKIDAVFERPDSKIVFFSGDRYWVFNGNHRMSNFPVEGRPLTEFSIPADVKKIDAAFVWGYNMRTYLVSGDMYWKMNENNSFVEYDYPRDMRTWKGVPVPVDAAFKDLEGKTFFFQGQDFFEFYDMKMQVKPGYPKVFSRYWLQCPEPNRVEKHFILLRTCLLERRCKRLKNIS
ncbi:Matrix metalloproteinase-14 [Bulinus truncatus]|nr:Matrix metalloproteinase-14 [Bulinus truncatus]